jgi:hypothetical protein
MSRMSERSARLVSDDPRSHVERINDWVGSQVFVQMARRDRGDTPMPEGKTSKYVLKSTAFDGGRMLRPGEVVELTAGQVGPHHLAIEGEKYDKDHKAAQEAMSRPRQPAMVEETIPLAHHREVVAALQPMIEAKDAEIAALKKENAALKAADDKEAKAADKEAAAKKS